MVHDYLLADALDEDGRRIEIYDRVSYKQVAGGGRAEKTTSYLFWAYTDALKQYSEQNPSNTQAQEMSEAALTHEDEFLCRHNSVKLGPRLFDQSTTDPKRKYWDEQRSKRR